MRPRRRKRWLAASLCLDPLCERIDLRLFKSAVAGGDEHNVLARKFGLLHVSPKRRCRAKHPARRHKEEAANRIEIEGVDLDPWQLACIRIGDSLSLTRKVQGVVRRDTSDRCIERARNFSGDGLRMPGAR